MTGLFPYIDVILSHVGSCLLVLSLKVTLCFIFMISSSGVRCGSSPVVCDQRLCAINDHDGL